MKEKIIRFCKIYWQAIIDSFKNSKLLTVLKIDILSLFIGIILIFSFLITVNIISIAISGGMTGDEMSAAMLTAPEGELQELLFKIKFLVIFLVVIGPIVLFSNAMIYGYSRQLVINKVYGKTPHLNLTIKDFIKKKFVWKWLWLLLLLVIIFSIASTLYLFVKYGFMMMYVLFLPAEELLWNQIASYLTTIFGFYLLFTLFTIEEALVMSNKSWDSISHGFSKVAKNFKKVTIAVLLSVVLFSAINFIIVAPLATLLSLSSSSIFVIVLQAIIILFFISWSRIFLLEVLNKPEIHKPQEHTHHKHHIEKE